MSTNWDNQAFTPISVPIPGGDGRKTVARFVCQSCGAKTEYTVKSGEGINPENLVKRAQRDGWDVALNKATSKCPRCASARKTPGEKPNKAEIMTKIEPKPLTVADLKNITQAQRSRVRDLIARAFDEEKGCYVPEWSDARVSEESRVGVAYVAAIREAAFGPILTTPEKESAKTDLVKLREEMDTKILSLSTEFDKKIKEILAKISE